MSVFSKKTSAVASVDVSKSTEKGYFNVIITYENRSTSNWTCTVQKKDGFFILKNIRNGKTVKVKE